MRHLNSSLVDVSEVSDDQAKNMYDLLSSNFINVSVDQFNKDLRAKDKVILLYSPDNHMVGFSTQVLFDHIHEGVSSRVVFSGDTIISPSAWGSLELPLAWGEWMLSLYHSDPRPLFWMLISKGIRTYKFLPTFFKDFYPQYDKETPSSIQKLMHDLGTTLFGKTYDLSVGLVQALPESYYLSPQLSEIPASRFTNPHIAYFVSMNKTYRLGSELLCLTRFEPGNLKSDYLRRLVKRTNLKPPQACINSLPINISTPQGLHEQAS